MKNRAYPARTVKEVRDILGVRLDDNLTSAEVVLIVEGDDDKIALTSILRSSVFLASALRTGRLAIDVLAGAGNLTHRVRLHADNICKVHAFLDDDASGRSALEAARKEGVLTNESANLTMVGGKQEAELEDLYREELYAAIIKAECGLGWQSRGPDKNKKWSDRVRNILRRITTRMSCS
jgi:putative ATP-dependent endonuclease of the OLD family